MSDKKKINENSHKAGDGSYIFNMDELVGMDAGPGYSSAHGPVVEGDRMQVGLIHFPRGTGARPHTHPNEQWIYILKGKVSASVDNQPESIVSAGSLIYLPADTVHSVVALPEEDVIFFTCKDTSHGIIGKAVDGEMSGPRYEPGFEDK